MKPTLYFEADDGRLLAKKPDSHFFEDGYTGAAKMGWKRLSAAVPATHDGLPFNTPGRLVTKHAFTVDELLAAYPAAAEYAAFLRRHDGGRRRFRLLRTFPVWGCSPRGFAHLFLCPAGHGCRPRLSLNDGDDGYVEKEFGTDDEAAAAFRETIDLAPFWPYDLYAFGWQPW